MYSPKFKYTHRLVNLLCDIQFHGRVVAEREVDQKWASKSQTEALCSAVSDTLKMENYLVSAEDVREILANSGVGFSADIRILVQNYADAIGYVEELVNYGGGQLNSGDIKEINRYCLKNLPKAEWHCGKFREIQNWVVDSGKEEIAFTPPSPEEVPDLIDALILWLNSETAAEIHPVIRAGITHLRFVFINPFVQGNERVACLISRYILQNAGFFARNLTWLSDYYAENMSRYYEKVISALDDAASHEVDLAEWLEYFAQGLLHSFRRAEEHSREAKRKPEPQITEIPEIPESLISELEKEIAPAPEELNERQRLILKLGKKYSVFHRRDIISELEIAGRYHPKTISRDLKALVGMGLLKQSGDRKGVRYSLVNSPER